MKRGLNSQTITVLSIILVAIFFTSFQNPTGFATKLNIPSSISYDNTKNNNTQTKITTPKQKNTFKTISIPTTPPLLTIVTVLSLPLVKVLVVPLISCDSPKTPSLLVFVTV